MRSELNALHDALPVWTGRRSPGGGARAPSS
jgi:hypothetical protein